MAPATRRGTCGSLVPAGHRHPCIRSTSSNWRHARGLGPPRAATPAWCDRPPTRGVHRSRSATRTAGRSRRTWWARPGSNRRPTRCKRVALPAALRARRQGYAPRPQPPKRRAHHTPTNPPGWFRPSKADGRVCTFREGLGGCAGRRARAGPGARRGRGARAGAGVRRSRPVLRGSRRGCGRHRGRRRLPTARRPHGRARMTRAWPCPAPAGTRRTPGRPRRAARSR